MKRQTKRCWLSFCSLREWRNFSNGQFSLWDVPVVNHPSCIYQKKYPVLGDESNYHNYLQTHLIEDGGTPCTASNITLNRWRTLYLWILYKFESISTKRQDKGLDPLVSILSTLRNDSCKSGQHSKVHLQPLVTNAAPRTPWPAVIDAAMPRCKVAIVVCRGCHGTITNALIFQTNRNRTPCYESMKITLMQTVLLKLMNNS